MPTLTERLLGNLNAPRSPQDPVGQTLISRSLLREAVTRLERYEQESEVPLETVKQTLTKQAEGVLQLAEQAMESDEAVRAKRLEDDAAVIRNDRALLEAALQHAQEQVRTGCCMNPEEALLAVMDAVATRLERLVWAPDRNESEVIAHEQFSSKTWIIYASTGGRSMVCRVSMDYLCEATERWVEATTDNIEAALSAGFDEALQAGLREEAANAG